jgi:hypothetical protein
MTPNPAPNEGSGVTVQPSLFDKTDLFLRKTIGHDEKASPLAMHALRVALMAEGATFMEGASGSLSIQEFPAIVSYSGEGSGRSVTSFQYKQYLAASVTAAVVRATTTSKLGMLGVLRSGFEAVVFSDRERAKRIGDIFASRHFRGIEQLISINGPLTMMADHLSRGLRTNTGSFTYPVWKRLEDTTDCHLITSWLCELGIRARAESVKVRGAFTEIGVMIIDGVNHAMLTETLRDKVVPAMCVARNRC